MLLLVGGMTLGCGGSLSGGLGTRVISRYSLVQASGVAAASGVFAAVSLRAVKLDDVRQDVEQE